MDGVAHLRSTVAVMMDTGLIENQFPAAPPGLPSRFQAPAGFQWGTFETADGARLRWGHLPAAMPRAECVLVGGFAEFVEKYFETIADLSQRGFSVWCLDWRGQGRSTRPTRHPSRPRRRDFDRDADDLIAFTRHVLPGRHPRILIAHSMGGAIALLALVRAPALFTAAVLSAPMLGVHTAPVPGLIARVLAVLGVVWGFAREFAPGRGPWAPDPRLSAETSLTSHDPIRCTVQQAWYTAQPDLRVDGPTYGWVQSALEITDRLRDPAIFPAISVPILIGCPGDEHFVDPEAEKRTATRLSHGKLVSYPTARHEL
ncbi:MAG: alpha/beta hydrolase, partial [Rhodospirillaceae bacterium]